MNYMTETEAYYNYKSNKQKAALRNFINNFDRVIESEHKTKTKSKTDNIINSITANTNNIINEVTCCL